MSTQIDEKLSKQTILEGSENRIEPAWLRQKRLLGLQRFEEMDWPSGKEEHWRHSSVRAFVNALRFPAFQEAVREVSSPEALADTVRQLGVGETPDSPWVIIKGNRFYAKLPKTLREQGVLVTSLADAVVNHGQLIETLFRKEDHIQAEGRFEALHHALWNNGFFVYVPEGVHIEAPIRLLAIPEHSGSGFYPHTLVVVRDGASAKIVEEYVSENGTISSFVNGFAEVHIGKNVQLDLNTISNWNDETVEYRSSLLVLDRNSRVNWITGILGGRHVMHNMESRLIGENSAVNMHGFYFGSRSEHFHMNTYQNHQTVHSKSDLLFKGVLTGRSHSVYRGVIRVEQGAQQTDAYQANRNLLLSDDAHVNSIPILEIEANDVRCTHGATIGQVDAEQVFYLQSRGLSRSQAEKLIVDGFLDEVISELAVEPLQNRIRARIDSKYFSEE